MKNKYGSLILLKVLSLVDLNEYRILTDLIRDNLGNVHAANFKTKWQAYLDKTNEFLIYNPMSPNFRPGVDANKTKIFKKAHNLLLTTNNKDINNNNLY